jgi:hypothetical protein
MDADYFRSGLARRVFLAAAELAFNGEAPRRVQRYEDDLEEERGIVAGRGGR